MFWLGKQKAKGKDKEFRGLTSIWVGSWGSRMGVMGRAQFAWLASLELDLQASVLHCSRVLHVIPLLQSQRLLLILAITTSL